MSSNSDLMAASRPLRRHSPPAALGAEKEGENSPAPHDRPGEKPKSRWVPRATRPPATASAATILHPRPRRIVLFPSWQASHFEQRIGH